MIPLSTGLDYIDLNFLGRPQIIATAVMRHASGVALIDPGPSTTIENLLAALKIQGVAIADVRHILLTHIHLDHAGATGSLVRMNPAINVFVHHKGARHVIDPSRLLSSAGRLYGQDMDRLWGEVLPVPALQVHELTGGEGLSVAGRDLEVAVTPGHASHHVSYLDRATRIAFVGDTAGIRRGSGTYILPPTPPPDIDLELWRASADRILGWEPETLFLTHFGPFRAPRPHFQQLFERLDTWSALVRRLLADTALDDQEREKRFVAEAMTDVRRTVGEVEAEQYSRAGRIDYSWQGLMRYWRNKTG